MRSGAVSALERRGLETLLERAALTLWNQDNPPLDRPGIAGHAGS